MGGVLNHQLRNKKSGTGFFSAMEFAVQIHQHSASKKRCEVAILMKKEKRGRIRDLLCVLWLLKNRTDA